MRARSLRPDGAEKTVRDICRATCRHYLAEEKIRRIALEGLRDETSIAELCREEGIAQSMYCGWSKELLETGKRRLAAAIPPARQPLTR
jgi:transposase-like protein